MMIVVTQENKFKDYFGRFEFFDGASESLPPRYITIGPYSSGLFVR